MNTTQIQMDSKLASIQAKIVKALEITPLLISELEELAASWLSKASGRQVMTFAKGDPKVGITNFDYLNPSNSQEFREEFADRLITQLKTKGTELKKSRPVYSFSIAIHFASRQGPFQNKALMQLECRRCHNS